MTSSDMIRRWFENLWNRGIEETIDEMMAPNIIVHGLGDAPVVGPEQFRTFYQTFRSAFPRVHVEIGNVWECGDTVVMQARVEVQRSTAEAPVAFSGAGITRVENGLFVESWNHFDFLGLLTGLNVVPADAMASALAPQVEPVG